VFDDFFSSSPSRRRVRVAAAIGATGVLSVLLGLTASAGGASARSLLGLDALAPASARASSPIIMNVAGTPATIDPASACGFSDMPLIMNTYVRLVRYGTKEGPGVTTQFDASKIAPELATSWTVSKNGRVYTFKLRTGFKFPSGRPVDAKAVKYSFDRVIKMNQCGLYFLYDGIYTPTLIKSVSAPNPTTVVIRLNTPDANALQDWAQAAGSIVDASVVAAHGGVQKNKANTWMAGHVAGAGPYILKEYSPNTRAVLDPNPAYNLPTRPTQEVIMNYISSDSTLLLQARTGRADITLAISKESAASLRGNSCCRVYGFETANSEQVYLSWKQGSPTANVKFRAALTYAIPYSQVLTTVAKGFGKLFYGPFPPSMPEYNAALAKPRLQNLALAKQLVQQSGVQTPVTLQLITRSDLPVAQQIATVLQGAWQQIGVNVQVQPLSSAQFENVLEKAQFQAAVQLDGPGVIEGGYYLRYDMKCGNPYNTSGMCMPAADALLAKAQRTESWPARKQLWNKLTKIWVSNSPKIKVYEDESVVVLGKRVKSYFYSHLGELRSVSAK
jgi:peptide/nickel transport system substrate-binding protein